MPATIEQLLSALRNYSECTGDPPEVACSLVMTGAGGSFVTNDPGMQAARERRLRGESAIEAYEDWVRRGLRSQIEITGQTEAEIVTSIVRGLDTFIEQCADDQAQARKKAGDERETFAVRLADPTQGDKLIAQMNSSPLGVPSETDYTRDNFLDRFDAMQARFVPGASLEKMQQARRRLDAWRESMAPLLNEGD